MIALVASKAGIGAVTRTGPARKKAEMPARPREKAKRVVLRVWLGGAV